MSDAYSKIMLTVIAGALVAIAVRPISDLSARAQGPSCGESEFQPCHVRLASRSALDVEISNLPLYVQEWTLPSVPRRVTPPR
jgi:hypothetical protein